jgi:hypothetical protein
MAQKPYKHNIEYIQRYYSYGSEAKAVEQQPAKKQVEKPQLPKRQKEPVTTICIDPIAFCGMMVAVVMLVVMLAGMVQYSVIRDDHNVMKNYVNELREECVLQQHQFNARFEPDEIETTARALGMIPVSQAQTISIRVEVPVRQEDPGFFDNLIWFFSSLFA